MNCLGMDAVTTRFNEYDLTEICQEYRKTLRKSERDVILPEKIGGAKVHLLIGIKNANLTPVLDRILESGVAVYTSPFKDIYGSNKIFAGRHETFTKANRGVRTHAVYSLQMQYCTDLPDSDEDSDTVSERVYSSRVDDRMNLAVHPHPLNREDVGSLGIDIPEQFGNGLLIVCLTITILHASYIFYYLYRILYLFKVHFHYYGSTWPVLLKDIFIINHKMYKISSLFKVQFFVLVSFLLSSFFAGGGMCPNTMLHWNFSVYVFISLG